MQNRRILDICTVKEDLKLISKNYPVSEKNIKINFDNIFSHLNRFYLGSLDSSGIQRINVSDYPAGAIVYDNTSDALKILSGQGASKCWKTINII